MTDERRTNLRGVREERLFIKVISTPSGSELDGVAIGCQTVDVSASGLRILVDRELESDSALELWVDVRGIKGKFLLKGVVRWVRQEQGGYQCGVELTDHDAVADLSDWRELFN